MENNSTKSRKLTSVSAKKLNDIYEELNKTTECPLNWRLKAEDTISIAQKCLLNLDDIDEYSNGFQNFVYYIAVMHETATVKKSIDDAIKIFHKYEFIYYNLFHNDNMKQYKLAFRHIFYSCKAILSYYEKNNDLFLEIVEEIPSLNLFDDANKAAILGTKAAVFYEFGPHETTFQGIKFAQEAIQLDPEQSEWHFLYGKGLHRTRRKDKSTLLPSKEELKSLEIAADLSQSPSHMVFLAEGYVDALKVLFQKNWCIPENEIVIYYKMGHKALNLCKEMAHKYDKSWYILLRCGMSFMKIPKPFTNLTEAGVCLEKAYQIRPESGIVCHQLSGLNIKLRNKNRAYDFAKKAANKNIVIAVFDEIRLAVELFSNYEIIATINSYLDKYKGHEKSQLLVAKGTHLLFIDKDLNEALDCYLQAVQMCQYTTDLENFVPCFKLTEDCPNYFKFSIPELLDTLIQRMKKEEISVNVDLHKLMNILKSKFPNSVGKHCDKIIKNLVSNVL